MHDVFICGYQGHTWNCSITCGMVLEMEKYQYRLKVTFGLISPRITQIGPNL